MSSNDESMISAMENSNNQIIEEIDNLITFLKQFKAPFVSYYLLDIILSVEMEKKAQDIGIGLSKD